MNQLVWAQLVLTQGHGFNLDLLQASHFSRTGGLTLEVCSSGGDDRGQEHKPNHASTSGYIPLPKADMLPNPSHGQGSTFCH